MTMLMDNDKQNSSRERVQRLFNKNAELENKRRKAAQARVPSDPNTWQNMRENYEAIILEDHAFSEQHDVEYALWQLHYRRIEELRALFNAALASVGSAASQNGKGPVRTGPDRLTKIRIQFKTFLSEATGFYHDLMLKIRAKYGLPLGYFSDDHDSQIPMSKDGNKSSEVKKGLISCHRCLIYLGDLARYKSLYGEGDSKARDFAAASSYYMQASSILPSSGNPHHQLAILAGYSNDELLSIYRYFRSLAVGNPFITARDNLIIAFEKNRQNYTQLLGDAKTAAVKTTPSRVPGKGRAKGETRPSFKDNKVEANVVKERVSNNFELFRAFVTRFVRLNGILFTRTSLETFAEVFSMVKNDLLELLSSGQDEEFNFGSDAAECRLATVRMIAILIFTVHNVNRESENQSYADILQRSVLLQNAFTATFEFMGCILERCNQLNDLSLSYLLPGIMVFVEWLACHQDVAVGSELEEKQVNARSFFWNKCIVFLNKLLSSGYVCVNQDEDETCFSNMSKYDESETANRLALPEDFELRGFIPLLPAQLILDFSRKHSFGGDGGNKERTARVQRIIAAGKALANIVRIGQEGVYFDTKVPSSVAGFGEIDFGKENRSYVTNDSFLFESASGASSKLSATVTSTGVDVTSQYLQPVQPSMSNWPVEHTPIMNGLAQLNLTDNGPLLKSELHDEFGVSPPAALSMPYPQFVSTGASHNYSIQIPQAAVPSKFDSLMSSGPSVDGLSMKPSSIMPPGSKKNPVGRPIRHFGPPPGFGSTPSKAVDEPLYNMALNNGNPPIPRMDDYRWLDGYQLSSSNQSVGFSNSMNQAGPAFPSVSKSNGPMEITTFPFPGKQVSTMQVQSEKQKGWQESHFSGHMKQYEEQHQQFPNGNQQPAGPPQQYQGQSLWESRFFV
ncbi:hypothetical protein DH2020_039013 [Rehmannia glutinosa]|uniref:Protein SMG7 n=1 Tax=Rehmannia glutinosa TaxID=99300 RepID=A0ABR0UX13_REHGL